MPCVFRFPKQATLMPPLNPFTEEADPKPDQDQDFSRLKPSRRPGQQPESMPEPAPMAGFAAEMPDLPLLQCCTSLNFWLLFGTCSIGNPM